MRYESLRLRSDFHRVFREGRSAAGSYVVVHAVENGLPTVRTGFPVTKKLGNAVRRNRIRRLLREALRLSKHVPPKGYDIVVVPRRKICDSDVKCQEVLIDLEQVLNRLALDSCCNLREGEKQIASKGTGADEGA